MELNLELTIKNVYGGDGFTRPYEVEEVKLDKSRTKTRVKQDAGVPVPDVEEVTETELKKTYAHTFQRDEDGTPMLRLGGSHGKLWGALKECAMIINEAHPKKVFSSFTAISRLMAAVTVSPVLVRLEDVGNISIKGLPIIMKGGKSQVVHYFDVIDECKAKVKIVFPDTMEKHMRLMLKQLGEISFLIKRRATAKVKILEDD